jgi:hypothetical protein
MGHPFWISDWEGGKFELGLGASLPGTPALHLRKAPRSAHFSGCRPLAATRISHPAAVFSLESRRTLGRRGGVVIVPRPRIAAIAKAVVGLAAAAMALCVAAMCTLQAIVWLNTRAWSPITLSQIFALAGADAPTVYATASDESRKEGWFDPHGILQWWLDAPAVVSLLVALALLATLYMWLASLQRALS